MGEEIFLEKRNLPRDMPLINVKFKAKLKPLSAMELHEPSELIVFSLLLSFLIGTIQGVEKLLCCCSWLIGKIMVNHYD